MEAGSEVNLCASLLQPNETLVMTVTLLSEQENTTLFQETSDTHFHRCFSFQAPVVQADVMQNIKVEVRGKTFFSTETKKVLFKSYGPLTFIQTDKPIYLPGQTVHFRIVSLDTKFRLVNEQYAIVELEDVSQNRIGQWLNTSSNGRILQLSHPLNSEAAEGVYSISVSIRGEKTFQPFKVKKYVLPKFDVKLDSRTEISVYEQEFKVKVCATYTYGQPVPGTVHLELCRPLGPYSLIPLIKTVEQPEGIPEFTIPCYKHSIQLEKSGCATYSFDTSVFHNPPGMVKILSNHLQLTAKVKALHFNDTPMADKPAFVFVGPSWSARRIQNLTTDSQGIASFSLDTSTLPKEATELTASLTPEMDYYPHNMPYHERGSHTLSLVLPTSAFDKTVSMLEVQKREGRLPCEGEVAFSVQYTIVGESKGPGHLFYMFLSRGAIVEHGITQVEIQDSPVTEGELSLKLVMSPEMAPLVQVLVYAVLPSETVIAHSMDFDTDKCFKHKVKVAFSPSTAVPGEKSSLQLTAQPGSLCGLSAVDQSVLIMEPDNKLDEDKILSLLPVKKFDSISYIVEDPVGCLHVRPRRSSVWIPPRRPRPTGDSKDAFSVFQELGLKMATNMVIREPHCVLFKGQEYHKEMMVSYRMASPNVMYSRLAHPGVGGAMDSSGSAPPLPPIQTVRTFFPETWIWDLVDVGDSGSADMALTVPDTITTWVTKAFCLAPGGFGLAPPLELQVFQPFFLELSLPYSMIRGESLQLKATVFNYLDKCIMVRVSPTPSSDYTLTPLSGDHDSSCLCANGRKTFSWTMEPSVLGETTGLLDTQPGKVNVTFSAEALGQGSCDNEIVSVPDRGRIDVVTRPLLVKAEGTEQSKAYSWLLCPTGGEALTEELELKLPEDVITGSARASVTVLGDILGRALQNLEGLLQMPYGCGEQNMALLAPNIYILEYLKNTQQLTSPIRDKTRPFLTDGYQRQLNYKHHDGAYSTFGQGDGNTWLTAFVWRSFGRAKHFVFIDPDKLEESEKWLVKQQQDGGCFRKLGKLFNNRMKGGVSDKVTLSAYITASMLEMNMTADHPVVKSSLSCLRGSISDLSNTYATALLAYTFSLAGDMETRDTLLQHLDKVATHQGGLRYWSQSSSETQASLSVEISSYVLLATLTTSPVEASQLGYASSIVRWLIRQQNSYGGFSSTQDTVVALQALSLYSTLVFSPEGSSTVTVQSPSGPPSLFDINQSNKLLYQERALQDVAGKYSVEVKGTTCASVQVAVNYNIPTPTASSTLSIQVTPEINCSSNSLRPKVTLKLQSLYSGKEKTTNMVIVDLKMLSGFAPEPESLSNLKFSLLVDRVDKKDDHVLIYLRELPAGIPLHHCLDIVQELPINNLKPAVVQIYDYYQPSDQSKTEYTFHCAAGEGDIIETYRQRITGFYMDK
ncbi:alpha-2-macroglobulin-P-like [Aplochiton taeniatus]